MKVSMTLEFDDNEVARVLSQLPNSNVVSSNTPETKASDSALVYVKVRAKFAEFVKSDRVAAAELLRRFNVQSFSELTTDRYSEFYTALTDA